MSGGLIMRLLVIGGLTWDEHYISHVSVALKALMKGVQKKGGEFQEEDLEDIVRRFLTFHLYITLLTPHTFSL